MISSRTRIAGRHAIRVIPFELNIISYLKPNDRDAERLAKLVQVNILGGGLSGLLPGRAGILKPIFVLSEIALILAPVSQAGRRAPEQDGQSSQSEPTKLRLAPSESAVA